MLNNINDGNSKNIKIPAYKSIKEAAISKKRLVFRVLPCICSIKVICVYTELISLNWLDEKIEVKNVNSHAYTRTFY